MTFYSNSDLLQGEFMFCHILKTVSWLFFCNVQSSSFAGRGQSSYLGNKICLQLYCWLWTSSELRLHLLTPDGAMLQSYLGMKWIKAPPNVSYWNRNFNEAFAIAICNSKGLVLSVCLSLLPFAKIEAKGNIYFKIWHFFIFWYFKILGFSGWVTNL